MSDKRQATFRVKQAVIVILTSLLSLAGSSRGQEKAPRATRRQDGPLLPAQGISCVFSHKRNIFFPQFIINP